MKEWTQGEIDGLVSCPKRITASPRREMVSERGSKRNSMELESADGEHRFRAFMRINEAFPENFSIGLDYIGAEPGGGFCLIRCNGPHEGAAAEVDQSGPGHHAGFHIHRAKAENLDQGFRAEKGAEMTKEYASYREALSYFLKECCIEGAGTHFKTELDPQQQMFDETEHGG